MFSMKTMAKHLCIFSVLFLAALCPVDNLRAQQEPGRDAPPARPYVGIVVGAGGLPGTFHGGCPGYSYPSGERSEYVLAGFVFGLPLGPFHLETRNLSRREARENVCPAIEHLFESGIHTLYDPLADIGTQSTSDLRLGYGLPTQFPVVASVGAGWVWGNDIPYLNSGLGFRTTGKFRLTVDLLWEFYRMPFLLTAQEWEDYDLVRIVKEGKDYDWQHAWSLQIGIAGYIR